MADSPDNEDDRLPLRWALIIVVALGAGLVAGRLADPLVGWATGLATVALLYKIVGH